MELLLFCFGLVIVVGFLGALASAGNSDGNNSSSDRKKSWDDPGQHQDHSIHWHDHHHHDHGHSPGSGF